MANMKTYPTANVGIATNNTVYTTPAGFSAVVIAANIANILSTSVTVDIILKRSGVEYRILKGLTIPPAGGYVWSGAEQKFVLETGDQFIVRCDKDSGADVILSVTEL